MAPEHAVLYRISDLRWRPVVAWVGLARRVRASTDRLARHDGVSDADVASSRHARQVPGLGEPPLVGQDLEGAERERRRSDAAAGRAYAQHLFVWIGEIAIPHPIGRVRGDDRRVALGVQEL